MIYIFLNENDEVERKIFENVVYNVDKRINQFCSMWRVRETNKSMVDCLLTAAIASRSWSCCWILAFSSDCVLVEFVEF